MFDLCELCSNEGSQRLCDGSDHHGCFSPRLAWSYREARHLHSSLNVMGGTPRAVL